MPQDRLTVGVIGTGRLGREHARVYASLAGADSLRLYDREASRAEDVASAFGGKVFHEIEDLLDGCDAVSVCTPATHHREAAMLAFERGVHVLVEKPIAAGTAEAREMIDASRRSSRILQVGHIERFNGAFVAARKLLAAPRFIESHRLGVFTPRGLDVSVVQDLMIHDIDLVLTVLRGERIVDLRASGAGVITASPDIVNARLEFSGGCVANVTASRISREPLRKMRFFQEHRYVSIDLREKSVEAYEMAPGARAADLAGNHGGIPAGLAAANLADLIRRVPVEVDRTEPLAGEIGAFLDAVRGGSEPPVTGEEGLEALAVAEMVLGKING